MLLSIASALENSSKIRSSSGGSDSRKEEQADANMAEGELASKCDQYVHTGFINARRYTTYLSLC
jgi:hypothetical protein